jgi:hypothetical protein
MSPADPSLALNAIHVPAAPSWWPPAPGWWLLAAGVLLATAFAAWRLVRRRLRRRRWGKLFDTTVAAGTPVAQIAAMSELLRRAARRIEPAADTLAGDDWLRFLDRGLPQPVFAAGAGNVLRDGGFRRELSTVEVDAVRTLARARFLDWMAGR